MPSSTLFAALTFLAPGPSDSVYGSVHDAITGAPLARVRVEIGTGGSPAWTSDSGLYAIQTDSAGAQSLSFQRAGYLLRRESGGTPAIALAGEVKLPTARNTLIGTRKTDFAGYLIASKRIGRFDTHADLGYTIVGRPAGAQLKNIFNFALAAEMLLGTTSELYAEVLGNTASSSAADPSGPVPPGGVVAEAPSGEIVASLGVAKYLVPSLRLSMGLSVDNNGAVLLRPGFTLRRH